MSTFELQTLIEKTSHWDKDERYMATNDICSFLNKNTNRIEEHWEQKICNAVLKQLGIVSPGKFFSFKILFVNYYVLHF